MYYFIKANYGCNGDGLNIVYREKFNTLCYLRGSFCNLANIFDYICLAAYVF